MFGVYYLILYVVFDIIQSKIKGILHGLSSFPDQIPHGCWHGSSLRVRILVSLGERKQRRENRLINEDRGTVMPHGVIEAINAIVATGKEAIVKQEHGKWLVLENGRRIIYREK